MSNYTPPVLPMPNDTLGSDIVIASCWQDDTSYSPTATILLVRPTPDYYSVVDISWNWETNSWDRDAETIFPNIIPAVEEYSDAIGGY